MTRARTPQETDWERIAARYDGLAELVPSPVIELNRAVALGMAYNPAGLDLVDQFGAEGSLDTYDLLALGRRRLQRDPERVATF